MNTLKDAWEQAAKTLADLLADRDVRALGDDDLLADTAGIERLGRLIDAARARVAGEVADRSRRELGTEGLAATRGCRSANELLQRITLVSAATADKRLRLGGQTRPRVSLLGAAQPALFPHVADALATGELGMDAAAAIIRGLTPVHERAGVDEVEAAERELVAAACGTGPDTVVPCPADAVRLQALVWQCVLDPDGADQSEQRALRKRFLRIGRERDGLIPVTGALLPEVAAKLLRLLDCGMAPKTAPSFLSAEEQAAHAAAEAEAAAAASAEAADADAADAEDAVGPAAAGAAEGEGAGPVVSEAEAALPSKTDLRSREQQAHDVFASLIDAIARSGDTPTIGGTPPTVLVTVRAEEVESGHGQGHIDGLDTPISMRSVNQFVCTGGTQHVVLDDNGRIVRLGSEQRCFTPQQRRAIMARDGGCIIPGCNIPAGWTEIHHVHPAADDGPTHTDNGVCLCWWHHHMLEISGWQIRMHHGKPQVRAPGWLDPYGVWRDASKAPTTLKDQLIKRLG